MKHGIRLGDCGDQMTVEEYSAWAIQSKSATYAQLHDGTCLVKPFTLKPRPRWRRADCQAAIERNDLVLQQRKQRARGRMALAQVS